MATKTDALTAEQKRCRRHSWVEGIRALPSPIRRGQQIANAEMYRQCAVCEKRERISLLNVGPQSVGVGQ